MIDKCRFKIFKLIIPIIVAIPPILAAYAMLNIMHVAKACCLNFFPDSNEITLKPIGSIIAVVAVFEIKALRKAVANINPPTILEGELPIFVRILNAMRLSKFQRRIAMAIIKPPKNKKII